MINKLRKSRASGFWHGSTFVSFVWFAANDFAQNRPEIGCVFAAFAVGALCLHVYLSRFASDAMWEQAFAEKREL